MVDWYLSNWSFHNVKNNHHIVNTLCKTTKSKLRVDVYFVCCWQCIDYFVRVFTTHHEWEVDEYNGHYDHFLYNPFFTPSKCAIVNRKRSSKETTTKQTTARRTEHHSSSNFFKRTNFSIVALYKIPITVQTQGLKNFMKAERTMKFLDEWFLLNSCPHLYLNTRSPHAPIYSSCWMYQVLCTILPRLNKNQ